MTGGKVRGGAPKHLYAMLIGGELVSGRREEAVINPADGSVAGMAPIADGEHLEKAVSVARAAFPDWSAKSWEERGGALQRLADAVEAEKEVLAPLLTLEQGKPYRTQALGEIETAISFLRDIAKQRLSSRMLRETPKHQVELRYVPMGVIGAITPWNFPVQLSIWKIAPNLLCGNTMVLKLAPSCPLSMLRFGEIAQRILPPGVLNIISGGAELGERMIAHPEFAKITFTGSTATGKRIMKGAADTLKRLTLELGGNDPAIVLPDADVKALAPILFWGAFYNSGQSCVAIKRLYVHESKHAALLAELATVASGVTIGSGFDEASMLGPVQNRQQFERVVELMKDSRACGHKFVAGGTIDGEQSGYFVPVTLVDNPPDDSRIVQEEQFGPILPVLSYKTVDEAVRRANDTKMGLAASVWGRDAADVGSRLQAGTVWINESPLFGADIPFGGHKQSGVGLELGEEGLAACMLPQVRATAKAPELEGLGRND